MSLPSLLLLVIPHTPHAQKQLCGTWMSQNNMWCQQQQQQKEKPIEFTSNPNDKIKKLPNMFFVNPPPPPSLSHKHGITLHLAVWVQQEGHHCCCCLLLNPKIYIQKGLFKVHSLLITSIMV